MRTEVLEVSEAGGTNANENGHTQDHQHEERRGSHESWNTTHTQTGTTINIIQTITSSTVNWFTRTEELFDGWDLPALKTEKKKSQNRQMIGAARA